ncbi:MAG: DJ-1/PfpI family protein [Actinomycetota bacterium]
MTTYGVLFFSDAEELDAVGPWEAFTVSAMLREGEAGEPVDTVVSIGSTTEAIRCSKGLRVVPDHAFDDHPELDVLLVPGGMGTRAVQHDETTMDWIRKVDAATTWTTSVCTGALLLHRSGVAGGRRLATHWAFEDGLEEAGATVERRYRWVVDGKVVSSQGVSAGIDMALWIVGALHGPEHARAVQHYMQYDPAPPYQYSA